MRCSLVVDGREVAAFAEVTVDGAELGPPEHPAPATATLRGGTLPEWPAAGRSCFLIVHAETGAPVAKYWLSRARPVPGSTVLICDYIEAMAP
jgi:hypothetical protein